MNESIVGLVVFAITLAATITIHTSMIITDCRQLGGTVVGSYKITCMVVDKK